MNFHNSKTKRIISAVIIVVIVLSMVIPVVISAFM